MPHKIRALVVGLIAVFALGIAAPAASATEGLISPDTLPESISGSQEGTNVLEVGSTGVRSFSCTSTSFATTSALSAAVSNISVTPSYSGCTTSPGGGAATISVGTCTYSDTATTKSSASEGEGSTTITGCGASGITLVAKSTGGSTVCEYQIANQGPLGKWTWVNTLVGKIWKYKRAIKLTGIVIKVLAGTLAACGAAPGATTVAKWIGNALVFISTGSGLTIK